MGYGNSKSYRVYNPSTQRILETMNVIFIETISRMFPPSLEETSQQIIPPKSRFDDHNYLTDDDLFRDFRYCTKTSVLERLPAGSADHIAVGGLSDNPPVDELWERISEITKSDCLLYTSPSPRD